MRAFTKGPAHRSGKLRKQGVRLRALSPSKLARKARRRRVLTD